MISPPEDPATHMAIDEALLLSGGPPTLRLYAWSPPALSLGYFQSYDEVLAQLPRRDLIVVRRITGGGAIYHHEGELTMSLTADEREPPFRVTLEASYRIVHEIVLRALREVGVEGSFREQTRLHSDVPDQASLCFYKSTPLDLVAGQRKLFGSAQRRTHGRVLHHGSLVLSPNPVTPATASVDALAGCKIDFATMVRAVVAAFREVLGVETIAGELSQDEEHTAQRLRDEKYASEAWTRRR